MTVTTIESNVADRAVEDETVILGKYKEIGRQRAARNRTYAAQIALENLG